MQSRRHKVIPSPPVAWVAAAGPFAPVDAARLRKLRRQSAAWTRDGADANLRVKGFAADEPKSLGVDHRGLIVHFPDYSVAPHCDGLRDGFIPWGKPASKLNRTWKSGLFWRIVPAPAPSLIRPHQEFQRPPS